MQTFQKIKIRNNLTIKMALIVLILFSFTSCLNPKTSLEGVIEDSKQTFEINGEWEVLDVKYMGDSNNPSFSYEINLYAFLGVGWSKTKGKHFYFESDGHWYSDAIDIEKKSLTYTFNDSLTLNINNDKLNYKFLVPILDSTSESMAWDIGNDVLVSFSRVKK